jgi:hypothetical protein
MCQEAGNIYNLVGIAKYALIAAGQREKVDALIEDVFNNSKSYEDAIKNIKKYMANELRNTKEANKNEQ